MNQEDIITLGTEWGVKVIMAVVLLVVGLWIAKKLANLLETILAGKAVDPTICKFLRNIAYGILVAFVIISVLDQVGVQTASVVAVLGAAGLAVGFALQGSLSHFASGVMLIIFRPIKSGDFVEIAGVSGVVNEISLFSTILTTGDNKVITVPNSQVVSGAIVNYSTKSERRVDLTVGVSYDADLSVAKTVLQSIIDAEERILEGKDVTIAVAELADSSVNFVVRVWVKSGDYWPVYFAMTEAVKIKLDEASIGIPYPQMDVHMHN